MESEGHADRGLSPQNRAVEPHRAPVATCPRCTSRLRPTHDPDYAHCFNCGEVFVGTVVLDHPTMDLPNDGQPVKRRTSPRLGIR